jgi:hypothetical protein
VVQAKNLPTFDLHSYEALLGDLGSNGYTFRKVSEMKNEPNGQVVFLRHDVDLHIPGIEQMAMVEAVRGIQATYYIPLTLHFNPLYPDNQRILRQIRDLGHEIGLHYDMETYPTDPKQARKHLDWEVNILSEVAGEPIRTICMHNPHKGQPDPWQEIADYVNPHDPRFREGLLYVSDSCRAWHDESLLTCFGPNPPRRLLLLTHPELWLDGTVGDRMQYLDQILMENGVCQHRDYFDHIVRQVWMTHRAPRLHDERERRKPSAG